MEQSGSQNLGGWDLVRDIGTLKDWMTDAIEGTVARLLFGRFTNILAKTRKLMAICVLYLPTL